VWNSVSDGQLAKYSNTVNCSAIYGAAEITPTFEGQYTYNVGGISAAPVLSTKVAHNLIIKKTDMILVSHKDHYFDIVRLLVWPCLRH
jgi:hypothetical protein